MVFIGSSALDLSTVHATVSNREIQSVSRMQGGGSDAASAGTIAMPLGEVDLVTLSRVMAAAPNGPRSTGAEFVNILFSFGFCACLCYLSSDGTRAHRRAKTGTED